MELPARTLTARAFKTARQLVEEAPGIIAVDVPIGLPESGGRECDQLARRLLGYPRRNSVFAVPIRAALHATIRKAASRITQRIDGRRVGCQSFALYKKIAEWDRLLRGDSPLQKRIYEVHPEVSFWAWNGTRPMTHRKKTPDGKAERRKLIRRTFGPAAHSAIDAIRAEYRASDIGLDDIYDAFAALWTAERILERDAETLPPAPRQDAAGLPMRIVC
jgi:predicted RNase H-like nuclease